MNRPSLLTTTTTFLRQALAKAFCCRWMLLFSLPVLLLSPAGVLASGVQAAQQGWQRMHALDAKQGLQAIAQGRLDDRQHLALDRCALHVRATR